jgi:Bacterial shufflon protein, N-terminal constant region
MSPSVLDYSSEKHQALPRGFGLLESVVALTISLSIMCLGAKYLGQLADNLLNQTTAQQLNRVATAASHYAHDHFSSLQSSTSHGESVIWKSQEIKQFLYDDGYLPNTLHDHNLYNQTYRIVIQQPQPQLLQLLVLTQGGQTIHEGGLRQITQWVGPTGGYVSQQPPNQATGSQEGWQIPLSGSVMMS